MNTLRKGRENGRGRDRAGRKVEKKAGMEGRSSTYLFSSKNKLIWKSFVAGYMEWGSTGHYYKQTDDKIIPST